ncbi:MAG: sulfatase-like hydrolase/transferase, partial [Chitinophagales bacterium]
MLLFIRFDLNDYIETLGGHPQIATPHIQYLAESGASFINAFSSSPGCAPSRTSMLAGKDVFYTKVYNNNDYNNAFRENFNEEKGNAVVFTLPEILKDSGGYYTYAINKVFHNPDKNDFDKVTGDPCAKKQSWNQMQNFDDTPLFDSMATNYGFLNGAFGWGSIPDSLERFMEDYRATDTAALFFRNVANGTYDICSRPFFMCIGYSKPHADLYIPEKYFSPFYKNDFSFSADYVSDTLFNNPADAFPYKGIVLPPQPDVVWEDY